jgi:hypothetical protein
MGGIMRVSTRSFSVLLTLVCVLLTAGALMAVGAPSASAYLPPALYSGSSATLSGTSTVTSPLVGGAPSAALYVKGALTNSGSGSLSTVTKVTGAAVPPMSVFMPDSRILALRQASQPAQPATGVTKYAQSLTISGGSRSFGSIAVTGSLTITGSGTYTFGWVKVSGSVLIKNASAKVSMDSLQVGGALTVSGGTFQKLGSAYVAGSAGLTGSGAWDMGLLVTDGAVTIGGTQTMGSTAKPVTILTTGP